VRGEHRHCPCNGVWLCPTCHTWAHGHPFEAKALGLIVSRHVAEPGGVTLTTWYGTVRLDCVGDYEPFYEEQQE
jgi:hypothetical protein